MSEYAGNSRPVNIDSELLQLRAACLSSICGKLKYKQEPEFVDTLLRSGATNNAIMRQLTDRQSSWVRARVLMIYLWRRRNSIFLILVMLLISGTLFRLFLWK